MENLQTRMQGLVTDFERQIAALAREAAVRIVQAGIDAAHEVARKALAARGGSPGKVQTAPAPIAATKPVAAPAAPARSPGPTQRAKGEKRPQAEVASLKDRLRAFIGANPGLRVEQINRELGTNTREVMLPMRKLIADGLVYKEGEKRSTTYHLTTASPRPASSGPVAPRRRTR